MSDDRVKLVDVDAEFEAIKKQIKTDLASFKTAVEPVPEMEMIPQGIDLEYDTFYYFEVSGTNPVTKELKEKTLRVSVGTDSKTGIEDLDEELARAVAVSDVYTHYPPNEGWVIADITIVYKRKEREIVQSEI